LDLNITQLPNFGGIISFDNAANCLLQRLIQSIGIEEIRSAAMNNQPMPSWSANDPRTKGFRDGKFSTADLEAVISLEDNFDKLEDFVKFGYCKACLFIFKLNSFAFRF